MRFVEQPVECLQRAEPRLDVAVVADVVAEFLERRRIARRQPHGVDAEPFEIIETRRDAVEVAEAIAVGIETRRHQQLVDRTALPPRPVTPALANRRHCLKAASRMPCNRGGHLSLPSNLAQATPLYIAVQF